jgi:hypothetical protein
MYEDEGAHKMKRYIYDSLYIQVRKDPTGFLWMTSGYGTAMFCIFLYVNDEEWFKINWIKIQNPKKKS